MALLRPSDENMPQDANRLAWIDMEMTGLDPSRDHIIEIAIVVSDLELATVAEAPVLVVHQPDAVLEAMDEWNKSTHARSGLVERVRASQLTEAEVEERMLSFLAEHIPAKTSPMCGNSICQDRRSKPISTTVTSMSQSSRSLHAAGGRSW
jgi:oligoribonuclease